MIPSTAVKAYLSRPMDSHLWAKDKSKKAILEVLKTLSPRPDLHPELRTHQLACFLLGVAYPQFAFWLDMGTGKTLITLELLRYWWYANGMKKAVVFVTSDKAFPTWEKQFARFKVDVPYVTLSGSSEDKWRAHAELDEGIVLVSYPGAAAMVTETVKRKRGKGNEWKLSKPLVERFWKGVHAVVLDESTRAANHGSLAFALVDKCPAKIRYALAGRPFGRDPTLLWAQHYLIDRGETLGTTLGMFRAAFFTDAPNRWVSQRRQAYIREYKFDKRKEGALARMIQHRSITYSAEECIELPSHVSIIEEVGFAEEAEGFYNRAIEEIIAKKGNMEVVKNVFLRMRQISSGFLGFKDDETGERAQVEFDENPKFDRLFERLDEMPVDRKGVVFYEYTHSGRKIFEEAKRLGFKPIWLWSGTKDWRADLHRFETDPQCRLAVINNRIGSMSLDGLQVANYTHVYESPVSVIDREQMERRLRRQGQVRKVLQYDYVVRGSVDQKILDFHAEGEALMTALLRDPKGLLGGQNGKRTASPSSSSHRTKG